MVNKQSQARLIPLILLIGVFSLFLVLATDSDNPSVEFLSPTPSNSSTQANTDIYVSVNASDVTSNVSTFIDFDNDLLGWWRMDDVNSTGDFLDNSTYDNDGIAFGNAIQTESGFLGKGLSLDGINSYVNCGSGFAFGTGNFTFSLWFKIPVSQATSYPVFLSKGTYNTDGGFLWYVVSNAYKFYIDAGTAINGVTALNDNKWHYGAVTKSGDNITLYLDGEVDASAIQTNINITSSLDVAIGVRNMPTPEQYFNGTIDDVMIFNRSLSIDEIVGLYANQTTKYVSNNFTDLSDGTHLFTAYSQDYGGNVNSTEQRTVTIITNPQIVLNSPANDSETENNYQILNSTITGGDNLRVYIFGSNDTTDLTVFDGLLYADEGVTINSEIIYNWTTLPIKSNDENLVLLLRFDNRSEFGENNTYVYDYSGNGNNATCTNCPIANITGGKFAGAFEYDGINDGFRIPNSQSLNLTNNFTMSFWVNIKRINDNYHRIIHKNGAYSIFLHNSGSRVDVYHYGHSEYVYSTLNILSTDIWHNIVYVQDSLDGTIIFVDGEIATGRGYQDRLKKNVPTNNNPVYIGIDEDGSSYGFNGTIGEIAIWNRTLDPEEIEEIYRLEGDKYFWKANVTDGTSDNETEVREFVISTCNRNSTYWNGTDCSFRGTKWFQASWDGTKFNDYWLDMPDDFTYSSYSPLVVYLHGTNGDRKQYDTTSSWDTLQSKFQSNGFIVAGYEDRSNDFYNDTARSDITDMMNEIRNDYNIDPNRIHIFGRSMGGGGSLQYAKWNEGVIASVISLYGLTNFTKWHNESDPEEIYRGNLERAFGGTPEEVPEIYKNESPQGNEYSFREVPVLLIHAVNDELVNVSEARMFNITMNKYNYTCEYIENVSLPGNPLGHQPTIVNGYEDYIVWFFMNYTLIHPSFSNYQDNNGSLVGSGTAWFNVTLLNTNGSVLLEIDDGGGSKANYTALNDSADVYNVSVEMTASGTYNYTWFAWGNGTINHYLNQSINRVYTVNVSVADKYPTFSSNATSPESPATFSTGASYEFNITVLDNNGSVELEFNGANYTATNISATIFNYTITDLAGGTYNYLWSAYGNGSSNYYNISLISSYTINTATSELNLTINSTQGNYTADNRSSEVWINSTFVTGYGDINIYVNGTLNFIGYATTTTSIKNLTNLTIDTTIYNISAIFAGNENYSASQNTWWINMTEYIPPVADTSPPNLTIRSPESLTYSVSTIDFNITANENLSYCNFTFGGGYYVMYKFNDTYFNYTNSSVLDGSWTAYFSCNDTSNNWNNTESVTFIIDTTIPTMSIVYPSNITYNVNVSNLNYTWTETNPNSCWYSNDTGNTNSTPITTGENFTNIVNIEGSNNWTVWCNDTASNEGTSSVVFVMDTVAPLLTIRSPNNATYSTSTIEFNITANEKLDYCNATIDDWANYYNLTSFNTTYFNYTDSVTDGQYTAKFVCNDTAGNINDTESITFIVDLTAPTTSIIYPTNTTYNVNVSNLNYTWTETSPNSCWYSNDTGNTNSTPVTMGNNFTDIVNVEGSNNWTVWCNDTGGNEGTASVVFVMDTIAPTMSIVYPTNTTYNVNVSNLNYTWSETNPNSCWYSNDTGNTNSTPVDMGTNFTNIVNIEGSNNWTVWCNDTASNEGTSSVVFVMDTIAPLLTIRSPGNSTYSSSTIEFNITANENLDYCNFTFGGSYYEMTEFNTTYFNYTNSSVLEGQWTAYFSCNDTAGNLNDTESITFLVDTTNPLIVFTYPENTTYSNETHDLNYTFTEGNCDKVWYYNGTDNSSLQSCGTNWTSIIANEGSNTWTIFINDTVGNLNSTSVTFVVDTAYPQMTVYSPENKTYATNEILINFTADSYDTLWFYNGTGNTTSSEIQQSFSDGSYTFIFYANDSIGNLNDTETVTFTIDTTYPEVNITYPANTTYATSTHDLNYTYTEINCNSIWYTKDNGATNSSTVACGTNWTGISADTGSNTWRLYINDTAGNENSSSVTFSITIDTIPPDLTIVSPLNLTYSVSTIDFNITANENLSYCNFTFGGGYYVMSKFNDTYFNYTNSSVLDGSWTAYFSCNDTSNNWNNTESITFLVDTTNPLIVFTYPENLSYSANVSNINYTYTETNCDKVWYSNTTDNSSTVSCGVNFTNVISNEGSNTWRLYINDTAGNLNDTEIITFFKDTINPSVLIKLPLNNTNTTNTQLSVNYTVSDINLDTCWWTNNTGLTNHTLISCANITSETWDEGLNTIIVYANDTINNINSSSVTFRIDTSAPVFDNLRNFSQQVNLSFSQSMSATDSGVGIDTYSINDTVYFNISQTGLITNISNLSEVKIHYLNITVNDTLNNFIVRAFYINITVLPPTVTPAPVSGGKLFIKKPKSINLTISICREIYPFVLNFGLNYTKIQEIQKIIKNKTDYSIKRDEVRNYMNNWQELCSDNINRTLKPEFVCSKIYNFTIEKNFEYDLREINKLKDEIEKEIKISLNLLVYYIDNYDKLCYKENLSQKIKKPYEYMSKEEKRNFFILIIIIVLPVLIVLGFLVCYRKFKKQ